MEWMAGVKNILRFQQKAHSQPLKIDLFQQCHYNLQDTHHLWPLTSQTKNPKRKEKYCSWFYFS